MFYIKMELPQFERSTKSVDGKNPDLDLVEVANLELGDDSRFEAVEEAYEENADILRTEVLRSEEIGLEDSLREIFVQYVLEGNIDFESYKKLLQEVNEEIYEALPHYAKSYFEVYEISDEDVTGMFQDVVTGVLEVFEGEYSASQLAVEYVGRGAYDYAERFREIAVRKGRWDKLLQKSYERAIKISLLLGKNREKSPYEHDTIKKTFKRDRRLIIEGDREFERLMNSSSRSIRDHTIPPFSGSSL